MNYFNKAMPYSAIAFISFSLMDCSDRGVDGVFVDEGSVTVEMGISSMFITNSRMDTVRFFAVEQELSTRIDLNISCNTRNTIAPRRTLELPFSKVEGYHSNCEILFWWWACGKGKNGKIEPISGGSMRLKSP